MNKKAMEVSINVIVGIILGLLMLTAGIVIFKQIVDKSKDLNLEVEEGIKRQMLEAFNPGDQFYIPETDKTIGLGKSAVFYFGIRNIYNEKKYFMIDVSPLDSLPNQLSTAYYEGPHEIDAMEKEIFLLLASTEDLPIGTYSAKITISICEGPGCPTQGSYNEYTNPRIVRLNVR